jgi:AhpD family alkylhydroperoxidase
MLKAPEQRQPWKNFQKHAAKENAALIAMGDAVAHSGLEPELIEFVKIRASQINGCAFCLQMHTADARKLKISEEKLALLVAWRETPVYSERERAALAWTESLTLVASHHGVPDDVYNDAMSAFSEAELAHLTAAVIMINAWNRIAISYRFTPQVPTAQAA